MENPLITTMNREILSASGFSTADYKENQLLWKSRPKIPSTFYICYNGYVGVYTSIDLYVNNGFPCNLQC
jgi:hypothetical protein